MVVMTRLSMAPSVWVQPMGLAGRVLSKIGGAGKAAILAGLAMTTASLAMPPSAQARTPVATAAAQDAAPSRAAQPRRADPAVNPVAEVASGPSGGVTVDSGNTAWVLTSTSLVLFMTLPGLALFYGGLARQGTVLTVLAQCMFVTSIVTVLWTLFGYSLTFSDAGMKEGVVSLASFIGNMDKALMKGVETGIVGTIPESLWFCFQLTFAIITPALVVGAFAERMKFSASILFLTLWSCLVYYPVGHMVWAGPGSFLGDLNALDFAGGLVVHLTSGVAGELCLLRGPPVGPLPNAGLQPVLPRPCSQPWSRR